MCGVIGIVGTAATPNNIFQGLKRVEYRGYDSAGIAIQTATDIVVEKAIGKLHALHDKLKTLPQTGLAGIGHTRWATHGEVSQANAHPHTSDKIVLLHNGIIENYIDLKTELQTIGYVFVSDTDTEVIAHLMDFLYKKNKQVADPVKRMEKSMMDLTSRLHGAYALVILCQDTPNYVFAIKYGSPLVLGVGHSDFKSVASSVTALMNLTNQVVFLEDEQMAVLTPQSYTIMDWSGQHIDMPIKTLDWELDVVEKNGYEHFMMKEIHEQPTVVSRILQCYGDQEANQTNNAILADATIKNIENLPWDTISKVLIIACGTSFYSGQFLRDYLEDLWDMPISVELASEVRYRRISKPHNTLVIAISQSGETIDTFMAVKYLKNLGAPVLSLLNALESSIGKQSTVEIQTKAGTEVGVASTKAFISQILVLFMIGYQQGEKRFKTITTIDTHNIKIELKKLPALLEQTLEKQALIQHIAKQLVTQEHILCIGRGPAGVIAYEGALKIKELTYMHAQAYHAGELKHGPISLIDENLYTICIATPDPIYYPKMISNIQEVKARKGKIIGIGSKEDSLLQSLSDFYIPIPVSNLWVNSNVSAMVALQLLAYWTAIYKNCDVDQPRNLAKSVTVE
jgi:glutamine---fructose-6-phosphate transaminase (isomerizing)